MRETHQVYCGGCRKDNTFHDFKFVTKELIFLLVQTFLKVSEKYHFAVTSILPPLSLQKLETDVFLPSTSTSPRKSPKPAKGIILPPTSTPHPSRQQMSSHRPHLHPSPLMIQAVVNSAGLN